MTIVQVVFTLTRRLFKLLLPDTEIDYVRVNVTCATPPMLLHQDLATDKFEVTGCYINIVKQGQGC